MSGKKKLPRPSTMPLLDQCPRFVRRPDDQDKKDAMDMAADEGSLLHAVMEKLTADHKVEDWNHAIENNTVISPAQTPLIEDAAAQVQDLFALGLPVTSRWSRGIGEDAHYMLRENASDGVYLEVSVDPGVTLPGTADVLMISGGTAVMTDYKFTRLERDHDAQMKTYVVGVFNGLPNVDSVEVRIVAPRLGDVHEPVTYNRSDLPALNAWLQRIVDKSLDTFEPGCPGDPCSFCAGNGRCVWQMNTLRDVPSEATTGLVLRDIWKPVLSVVTPEMRGVRRSMRAWLTKWLDAVKEDDKEWAIRNPEAELPGFKKAVAMGRLGYDAEQSVQMASHLHTMFGIEYLDMMEFMKFSEPGAVEYLSLHNAIPKTAAKLKLREALGSFMKRGPDSIRFTATKKKKELTK